MASMTNASALTMLDVAVDAVDTDSVQTFSQLRCYDGSVPINVDATLSGNTLLAALDMAIPAFGSATDQAPGALAAAGTITDDEGADATGTVSFARLHDRAATPLAHIQVTAGQAAEELVFNTSSFEAGVVVQVSSLDITLAEI